MAYRRRKNGEALTLVNLLVKIDPAVKERVERVAKALDISQARATELLLKSVPLDENGRPLCYIETPEADWPPTTRTKMSA